MAAARRECVFFFVVASVVSIVAGQEDSWETVAAPGVSAMHATLMMSNRVIFYDRTDFGKSNISFPDGYCRKNPRDLKLKVDCTAHSLAYEIATNAITCLKVFSNPFCSSGAHRSDGTLYQTGGWNDGGNITRTVGPGANADWVENPAEGPKALLSKRWYASTQILPDDRVIVVGGRREFSYEFQPRGKGEEKFMLPFLRTTNTPGAENNLYPFLFLHNDGNLIIFANQDCILLNYITNTVVKKFPRIPDGPRTYPSTGAGALLPISAKDGFKRVEIMICGGAPFDSFQRQNKGMYDPALKSCGRLDVTAKVPKWVMVDMPMTRVMCDMLILSNGELLVVNGAGKGTAGWGSAREPVFTPLTYDITRNRFNIQSASPVPRMYHSVAVVLPDGKIFVAGSNTHAGYVFKNTDYPTEFRIEKYSPFYLNKKYDNRRPKIVAAPTQVAYGAKFQVSFVTINKPVGVKFHLYAPSFTTHSNSMNQRMLVLGAALVENAAQGKFVISATVTAPPNPFLAPRGYYLLTVVNQGIPSSSSWVKVTQ